MSKILEINLLGYELEVYLSKQYQHVEISMEHLMCGYSPELGNIFNFNKLLSILLSKGFVSDEMTVIKGFYDSVDDIKLKLKLNLNKYEPVDFENGLIPEEFIVRFEETNLTVIRP